MAILEDTRVLVVAQNFHQKTFDTVEYPILALISGRLPTSDTV
jgi:hypothetical protein